MLWNLVRLPKGAATAGVGNAPAKTTPSCESGRSLELSSSEMSTHARTNSEIPSVFSVFPHGFLSFSLSSCLPQRCTRKNESSADAPLPKKCPECSPCVHACPRFRPFLATPQKSLTSPPHRSFLVLRRPKGASSNDPPFAPRPPSPLARPSSHRRHLPRKGQTHTSWECCVATQGRFLLHGASLVSSMQDLTLRMCLNMLPLWYPRNKGTPAAKTKCATLLHKTHDGQPPPHVFVAHLASKDEPMTEVQALPRRGRLAKARQTTPTRTPNQGWKLRWPTRQLHTVPPSEGVCAPSPR